jgi:hypothetical protein
MIIRAAGRFACRHRYIVTPTDDRRLWLFVCEGCGHRTELLPITLDAARGEVVAFPPLADVARPAPVSSGPSPSAFIQSA